MVVMERSFRVQTEPGILYRDRRAAGAFLAENLAAYRGRGVLVLGIARGGVIVAAEVARRLNADMDVVVARKLGAPGEPELAIGAVTADGSEYLDADAIRRLGVTGQFLEAEAAAQMAEARRREERYRAGRQAPRIRERTVILVDDGLATGATMRAAIRSVCERHPTRLIVAVPVGSSEACAALLAEADELVCPYVPKPFMSVGMFFNDFGPTGDAEVERLLRESREARILQKARHDRTSPGVMVP
jgi:putative phosphoribosyl transferase